MPLKSFHPDFTFSGNKVTPDEVDQDQQYIIMKPTAGSAYFGTVNITGDGAAALVIDQTNADYPRAINLSILGVAGGMGGTAVVNGQDQFGNVIQESLGFATAAGGGTANGTLVFAKVTSGTVTIAGLGGTAVGSSYLGVNIGGTPIFGLPAKLGGSADVKRGTWVDNGVGKMLNVNNGGGTSVTGIAGGVVKGRHGVTINVAGGVVAADDFVITYRSSFNQTDDRNVFKT